MQASETPLHLHLGDRLVSLALPQNVTELLQRAPDELGLLPEVGGEEAVGVADGNEGGLEGVLEGLGRTGGAGVGVLDTGELEETLDSGGGNETSTARGGDQLVTDISIPMLPILAVLVLNLRGKRTLTVTEPHLPLCLTGRE